MFRYKEHRSIQYWRKTANTAAQYFPLAVDLEHQLPYQTGSLIAFELTLTSPVSSSTIFFPNFFAMSKLSSLPLRPSARPPARLMLLAIPLLMLPHRTISAISTVAGSDTRTP